jgi:hypothetical protein
MLFDQVGELVEQLSPNNSWTVISPCSLECLNKKDDQQGDIRLLFPVSHFLGCIYGYINILFASRSNAGDNFSRRCEAELLVCLVVRNKEKRGYLG